MRNIIFTLLGWLLLSAGSTVNDGSFFTAPMVVLDERFYQFIDPDSKIERLVPESGREFG